MMSKVNNMKSKIESAIERFEENIDAKRINQEDNEKWLKLMEPLAEDGKVSLEAFTKAIKEFINQSYDQTTEGWV